MTSANSDPAPRAGPVARLLWARWPRIALDVGWCAAFAVLLTLVLLEPSPVAGRASVELALAEGGQRQALYRGERRIGTVVWSARRRPRGWRVEHSFLLDKEQAARTVLELRRDLSLSRLELEADVARVARISGGMTSMLLAGLKDLDRIAVQGDCSLETGDCHLLGKVGRHVIDHHVTAGRGPVVTSAIYPLLARGSLGGTAELRIFDPLSLGQRLVTFTVEGREELQLHSGRFDALRVVRDLDGLVTRVWIDGQGRVMKEELPLGMVAEHEAWQE